MSLKLEEEPFMMEGRTRSSAASARCPAPPAQGSLFGGWPALLERESHPLEYTTLPGLT